MHDGSAAKATRAKQRTNKNGDRKPDVDAPAPALLDEANPANGRMAATAAKLTKLTGWNWSGNETGGFCQRARAFPRQTIRWRKEILADAAGGSGPLAAIHKKAGRDVAKEALDTIAMRLRELSRILVLLYADGPTVLPDKLDEGEVRVLRRLGLFAPFPPPLTDSMKGLAKHGFDLIPPELLRSLTTGLRRHAASVCTKRKPSCGDCELARFCGQRRKQVLQETDARDTPTVVDLFSGAGGLSKGFASAGFLPVLAVDADQSSCLSYRMNFPQVKTDSVICSDIRELGIEDIRQALGTTRPDVLVGGPPCQGFSLTGMKSRQAYTARRLLRGYRISEDRRNQLFEYLTGLADELKPRLVLMENVPGMDSARKDGPSFMQRAEERLQILGYKTAIWRLEASAFGVPQFRARKFLVATSDSRLPVLPESNYQDRSKRQIDPDDLPPVNLGSAIFDLPPLEAGEGSAVLNRTPVDDADPRLRFILDRPGFRIRVAGPIVYNHRARYQNERDLEIFSTLHPGEDSVHLIERHGRSDLMKYRQDIFDDKYARMRPDAPSKTIVAHLSKDGNSFIHPSQTRSITVRESARLQTFPDDFVFCGTLSEQWSQVGNSVPPLMAQAIAKSFMQHLRSGSGA